jgi:hypothetical protein
LPDNSGLNLKVNNLKQDTLEIFIITDEEFRSENHNLIYLFIQTHGIINHLTTQKIAKEITRITIPKNSLIPGINQLTISDAFNKRLEGTPCVMIDVVWEKYRVGNYLFNGIVNLISKTGDFSNGTLPVDAMRLHYRVLDPVCSFVSPDYLSQEIKNTPVADYRNTLYWNPAVKPDKNGRATIEF